ncbi:Wadjet anti-phage system protein JetD domain-containing protein [Anaerocolumna sp.]|uniref:Wadjet anti-phage system protein JetD domain-containing protein n=1 Tax=Anaerocolumna sp. TaxID=2041569 RepID=UPI0028A5E0B6|nr:Wadjet anti-phage system protein JetD domain-containing protein [Anaerocolumna sp.]
MKLLDLIIDQYERSSKWNNETSGNASFRIEEKHYKIVGKATLIDEAKELECSELLKIRWVKGYYNVDIEKVEYPLSNMTYFYQMSRRKPKYISVAEQKDMVMKYYHIFKKSWIRNYIKLEVLPKLEKGDCHKNLKKGDCENDLEKMKQFYQCLYGLDQLESPMFKRVFSKRYLNNSKVFEKELQKKIISIARKYADSVEEAMDSSMEDSDILNQLYIEEYSQELNIKGKLRIEVEGSVIDTGCFPYGTVLNSQTIKNAIILDNPQITKILTIENKANFTAEPMEEGTLIIFSHGYFSPLERKFLKELADSLLEQPVTYLHSGDLDFGGVCIFRYIKNRIFPQLKPYRMDKDTFEKYKNYGEPIETATLEKLNKLKEPMLQELINLIIETGLVIEQEAYL